MELLLQASHLPSSCWHTNNLAKVETFDRGNFLLLEQQKEAKLQHLVVVRHVVLFCRKIVAAAPKMHQLFQIYKAVVVLCCVLLVS